jgi:hypothetical protein
MKIYGNLILMAVICIAIFMFMAIGPRHKAKAQESEYQGEYKTLAGKLLVCGEVKFFLPEKGPPIIAEGVPDPGGKYRLTRKDGGLYLEGPYIFETPCTVQEKPAKAAEGVEAKIAAQLTAMLHDNKAALKCGRAFISAPEGKLKPTNLPDGAFALSVKDDAIYLGEERCELVPKPKARRK